MKQAFWKLTAGIVMFLLIMVLLAPALFCEHFLNLSDFATFAIYILNIMVVIKLAIICYRKVKANKIG